MKYHAYVRKEIFPHLPEGLANVLDIGGGYGNTVAAVKEMLGAQRAGVVDSVVTRTNRNPQVDYFSSFDLDDDQALDTFCRAHGPFSAILCLDVLEHLKDPWRCVELLERHLEPDGVLIAIMPNVAHVSVVMRLLLLGEWRLRDSGILDRTHLRFFTKDTARELLESGGFVVDCIQPIFSGHTPLKQLKMLRLFIGERWFAFQYLLRARKRAEAMSVAA